MTQKQLLKTFGHLLGRPVRIGDEPDRMITKILHEEPNGNVCVETGELYAFRFSGEWERQEHLPNAVKPIGNCNRGRRRSMRRGA